MFHKLKLTLIIMYIQDSVSSVSLYCRYMYFLAEIDQKPLHYLI